MVVNFNVKNLFYRFFDRLYPWVAKLDNLPGIGHDDMVMLLVEVGFFIMALVLAKLVPSNQAAFQKQFYRVVERSAAHTIVFILHLDIQRFNVKMLLAIVYFLKYGIALRGFPVPFIFQEFCKNVFYNVLVFIIFHGFDESIMQRYGNFL